MSKTVKCVMYKDSFFFITHKVLSLPGEDAEWREIVKLRLLGDEGELSYPALQFKVAEVVFDDGTSMTIPHHKVEYILWG